jgi:hypothetical protein
LGNIISPVVENIKLLLRKLNCWNMDVNSFAHN